MTTNASAPKDLSGQPIKVGDRVVITARVGTRYKPALAEVKEISIHPTSEELNSCMLLSDQGRKESRYLNEVVKYGGKGKQS